MKTKTLILFVLVFGSVYLGTLVFLKNSHEKSTRSEVLSAETSVKSVVYSGEDFGPFRQNENSAKVASMSEPATPEATAIPIPTPTSAPTPTSTPTPTPEPTAEPEPTATPDVWSPADMEPIFSRYAGQYGVDKNVLERIANCESHFNPNAQNLGYLGMFQFGEKTWTSTREQMGEDINPELRRDVEQSIKTAAYLVSVRGTSPWPSCL